MDTTADRSGCDVDYDAEVPCVVMRWTAYVPAAFRAANERVLAELVEHGADRLLGEMEALEHVAPADAAWLANDWIPRAAEAGLRYVALVTPAFAFGARPAAAGRRTPAAVAGARIFRRDGGGARVATGAGASLGRFPLTSAPHP